MGFFDKLKQGLGKTRSAISEQVNNVFKVFVKVDDELFENLEEALIMADLGVETSTFIIEQLRDAVKTKRITDGNDVKEELKEIIASVLCENDTGMKLSTKPSVILVIGVNGVGKTTSIGKLASFYKSQGKSVLLAAADTFRAAAIDQLNVWAERSSCDIIKHQENSDPAAVVFDACNAARARGTDILICDTAGRLHNKKNLMAELEKIGRVIDRELPGSDKEILLVLDATTGQNAVSQAKLFGEVAGITGIILTKLDGTAKGGIVVAISREQQIPVKFIGVGEGIDDLQEFNAPDFSRALFED
ncbi:MAG: signal recognition particle-docking protein FtsY [Clostridia bacterium]|nr:signal recognition particle-docking protein FtsY [Clostridia bacterium]